VAHRGASATLTDIDAAAVRAVMSAGCSHAWAAWRVPGLPTRFAMPRIGVMERDHRVRFIAKIFLGAIIAVGSAAARQWAGRPVNPLHRSERFRRHLQASLPALLRTDRAALVRHVLDG
jgi:hypothetical protein